MDHLSVYPGAITTVPERIMKFCITKTIILSLIFIIFSCSNSNQQAGNNKENSISWYGIEDGMEKAKKEGKSILMFFYTDWCVYCKKMDNMVFNDPEVSKYMNEKFINIRVNPEKNKEQISVMGQKMNPVQFMQQIGASGFPTTMFWDKKQKPLTVLPGFTEKDTFLSVITYINDECYNSNVSLDDYMKGKTACSNKK